MGEDMPLMHNDVAVCNQCGAMLLKHFVSTHEEWHRELDRKTALKVDAIMRVGGMP